MTTLVLEDLFEEHQDMVNTLARHDAQGFLSRAAERAGVLVSICCYCSDVIGFKDSQGAPGGLSHTACPTCGAELWAQLARERALRTRN